MLRSATHTPNVSIAESGPTGFIQQTIPYVYAFGLGTAPVLESHMPLGRIVTVAVADGTRASHAPDDLFARRVPGIPAVTGPVHVTGVRRGDNLEIELIALEANDSGSIGQLLATIAVASSDPGEIADPVQTTYPRWRNRANDGSASRRPDSCSDQLSPGGTVTELRAKSPWPPG